MTAGPKISAPPEPAAHSHHAGGHAIPRSMTTGVDVPSAARTAAPPVKTQIKNDVPAASVLRRLLHDYVQGHWGTLVVAMILMAVTAGTSTALAYLLGPTVKSLFVEKDPHMLLLIPAAAFGILCLRAASMYGQQTMIESLGEQVVASVPRDMFASLVHA